MFVKPTHIVRIPTNLCKEPAGLEIGSAPGGKGLQHSS